MYFKITNKKEKHHGFQYQDGLNILIEEFNDDLNASCCAGGFYFTDAANIFKFLDYGIYLREISLPTDDKNFKMLKDKGDKWRSNMIILGKRYDLNKAEIFKFLVENGADIHINNDYALRWSAFYGHADIVKFLIGNGANVHADDEYALIHSACNGHLDVVKILVESGANIQFLVESGANIHAKDNCALEWSTNNGHTNVADFLISKGAKLKN